MNRGYVALLPTSDEKKNHRGAVVIGLGLDVLLVKRVIGGYAELVGWVGAF